MKKIQLFILIILVGGLAGILASQFLMPYLAHTSPFEKISWLKKAGNGGTTIINKTEQLIIEDSQASEKAIEKINPSVVGIMTSAKLLAGKTKKPGQPIYGTGFIITGDGMILAPNSAAPQGNYDYFISRDNQSVLAEVVKRDEKEGMVLLKIKETNLPVVSFGRTENLRLGQEIILVGVDSSVSSLLRNIKKGVIEKIKEGIFYSSIEKAGQNLNGAPFINISGEVIGLSQIDSAGKVSVVSIEEIKKFLGQ